MAFSFQVLYGGGKLLYEHLENIEPWLGKAEESVNHAPASLPFSDVRRYTKDGFNVIVFFQDKCVYRAIIIKQDNTELSDKEIGNWLGPNRCYNAWSTWDYWPQQRAWVSGGKIGPWYALVANKGRSLELLTYDYMVALGRQTWFESTGAANVQVK